MAVTTNHDNDKNRRNRKNMKGWTSNNKFNYDGVSTDAPAPLEPGLYKARIASAEPQATKEGKPMIKLTAELFEDADGNALKPFRKVVDNMVLTEKALFRVKILAEALDIEPIDSDAYDVVEAWCRDIVKAAKEGVFTKVKHEKYEKNGEEKTALRIDRYLNASKVAAEASSSSSNGAGSTTRRPRRTTEAAQA